MFLSLKCERCLWCSCLTIPIASTKRGYAVIYLTDQLNVTPQQKDLRTRKFCVCTCLAILWELLVHMSSWCSFSNFALLISSVSTLVFLLQHQQMIPNEDYCQSMLRCRCCGPHFAGCSNNDCFWTTISHTRPKLTYTLLLNELWGFVCLCT